VGKGKGGEKRKFNGRRPGGGKPVFQNWIKKGKSSKRGNVGGKGKVDRKWWREGVLLWLRRMSTFGRIGPAEWGDRKRKERKKPTSWDSGGGGVKC